MQTIISLKINGEGHRLIVQPRETLLDVLRDKLNMTGTKKGCNEGDCGACTVLMDGKAVLSCLILAVTATGKNITTIEGLAENAELHPLQKAFVEHGAIQCGFCTPGQIMASKALLDENPDPTEGEIKEALAGNLCRCTGYVKIVDAVKVASKEMRRRGGK